MILRHILLILTLVRQCSICLRETSVDAPLFLKRAANCAVLLKLTPPSHSPAKKNRICRSMKVNYNRSRSNFSNDNQSEHLICLVFIVLFSKTLTSHEEFDILSQWNKCLKSNYVVCKAKLSSHSSLSSG